MFLARKIMIIECPKFLKYKLTTNVANDTQATIYQNLIHYQKMSVPRFVE